MFDLEKGEEIILETRRHWFVFLGRVAFLGILAIIPLIFYATVSAYLPTLLAQLHIGLVGSPAQLYTFCYAIFVLYLWMCLFVIWTDYYLDMWFVTNKRIIAIEQKGMFHREISSFRLDNIQDITIETEGVIATLLKFGNVHVETAGEDQKFIIRTAHDPEFIKSVIFEAHNKSLEKNHHSDL